MTAIPFRQTFRVVVLSFISLTAEGFVTATATADDAKPLQVYILAGQSNMQGHAKVSTIAAMKYNEKAAPLLKEMLDTNNQPIVCDNVWISSIGSSNDVKTGRLTAGYGAEARGPKIGPEFTFGITVGRATDGPVLIIKTAWGGKSLHTDFRPPSADSFKFSDDQIARFEKQGKDLAQIRQAKQDATGHYYRLMLDHVRATLTNIEAVYPDYDKQAGYKLAGFVWFQGWNDMVASDVYPNRSQPGGYGEYSRLLEHFIRDVRSELGAPRLPFVIGVMGVGGPTNLYDESKRRYQATHQNFRDAMAAPAANPEFSGTVTAVLTENAWDLQVAKLRQNEQKLQERIRAIRDQVKARDLSRADGDAQVEAIYANAFSETELAILRESTSNADFHYMGSAGVMALIGQAFAEAVLQFDAD